MMTGLDMDLTRASRALVLYTALPSTSSSLQVIGLPGTTDVTLKKGGGGRTMRKPSESNRMPCGTHRLATGLAPAGDSASMCNVVR